MFGSTIMIVYRPISRYGLLFASLSPDWYGIEINHSYEKTKGSAIVRAPLSTMSSNRYVSSHYTQQIHKQPDTVLLRLNVLVNTFARFVHTQEKQRQWASKCALHFVILADPTHYFGAGPTYDVLVREGLCYIFMDPAQWDLLRNVHSVVFQTRILQELGECERKVMLRVLGAVRTIDDEANA